MEGGTCPLHPAHLKLTGKFQLQEKEITGGMKEKCCGWRGSMMRLAVVCLEEGGFNCVHCTPAVSRSASPFPK